MIISLYDMADRYRARGWLMRLQKVRRVLYHQEMELQELEYKKRHGICLLCHAKQGAPNDAA